MFAPSHMAVGALSQAGVKRKLPTAVVAFASAAVLDSTTMWHAPYPWPSDSPVILRFLPYPHDVPSILTLIALVIATVAVGWLLGPDLQLISRELAEQIGSWLALPGYLFLTLIRFVVIPLVIASVAVGIAGGDDAAAVKKIGGAVVVYFVATTTVAITIGLTLTKMFAPGLNIDRSLAEEAQVDIAAPGLADGGASLPQSIVGIMPTNPIEAMAQGQMLQIVIASAIFGLALLMIPKRESTPLMDLLVSVQAACMAIVTWLMKFAPVAVFGLLADVMIKVGLSAIAGLLSYVMTFLLTLLAIMAFYMVVVSVVGKRNPVQFMKDIREPFLIAFSTSSSSATMPITLRAVEKNVGVHPTVGRLVVPLGATINMDGTAAYQAVAVLFLAQVFGVDMSAADLVTLVVVSIGASIGTPGMPGGSIPILITILISVGIPYEGVALILSVDRILDMARTAVNVTGDAVTCTVMERVSGLRGKITAAEAAD